MNTLLEGLHLNYTPFKQPDNSYRFALNSMISEPIGTLTNEIGNDKLESQLPSGYYLIGSIQMNADVCLFSTDGTNSEIGILSNDVYTSVINSVDLNFQLNKMIKGVFRIKNGCERIIYFCDGYNYDRVINLDNLSQYGSPFDVTLTKYYPEYDYPVINNITVNNTGGLLELGAYEIGLAYVTQDNNETDVICFTNPVKIYKEYTTSIVDNITGGYNIADYENGDLPSTKSISYNITNLDTSYPFLRIYIIATIGGDGTTKLYYKDYDITIPENGSLTYTLDKLNDLLVSSEGDVTVNKAKYKSSEQILLTNNVQIKQNLKEQVYDYVTLQQYVNEIAISYKTKEVSINSIENTYKDPESIQTFMRDEVYSLGIVYVYKDGNESPVMHIPGRSKNTISFWNGTLTFENGLANILSYTTLNSPNHIRENYTPYLLTDFDTDILLVGTQISESEVEHLGYTNGDSVPFYKVFNTAVRAYRDGTDYYGSLAYHESDTRYPSVKDCNGNFIYPVDPLDNTQTAFIRHHKIPDAHIEPFYDVVSETIRPLELVINNVNNPDPTNIIGYYIVRGDSKNDQTVLDKGLFYNPKMIAHKRDGLGNLIVLSDAGQNNILCDYPLFLNPISGVVLRIDDYDYTSNSDQNGKWYGETSMTGPVYTLDLARNHIAFQSNMSEVKNTFANGSYIVNETEFEFNWNINASDPSIQTWVGYVGMPSATRNITQIGYNYKIDTGLRIPFNNRLSNSLFTDGSKNVDVYNAGQNQSITYYQTNRDSSHTDYRLIYRDTSDDTLLDNINSYVRYGSIKIVKDVYNNLSIIKYEKTHTNLNRNFGVDLNFNILGGDTFIGKAVGRKTSDAHYTIAQRIGVAGGFQRLDITSGTRGYWMSSAWIYYTESRINPDMRHESSDNASKTLLKGMTAEQFLEPYDYTTVTNFENSAAYFYQNNFLYNDDYTVGYQTKYYYPLDNKYKYCDDCAGEYSTRTIYSDVSLDESREDNYLKFRVNNYIDYPNDKGEIKNSYVLENVLYTLTERALYFQPLSNQQLQTDTSTVYIGTGDFLSVPWQRKEFIGTGGRHGVIKTEYGIYFIDHIKRRIYFNGEAISETDIKTWLFDNMSTELLNVLPNYLSKDSMMGVGTFISYDPNTQRILINHKDYKPLYPINEIESATTINYINGNFYSDGILISLDNISYFENKCWTLSYYPKTQKFISFHSYNPLFWFNNDNYLYTTNSNTFIYKHNSQYYNSFYETKYPWIIEVIEKNISTATLESIKYVGNVLTTDNVVLPKGLIFNYYVCYTDTQSTGEKELVLKTTVYDNIVYDSTKTYLMIVEENNRLDNIRSLTNDITEPQMTNLWDSKQIYYSNGQGYIDKVYNSNIIDYNKNLYDQDLLRSKVFHIRMIENGNDYNLRSIEVITPVTKISKR